ncbi:MAG TPA: HipA domain-containing protein [Clostridia bacterium]|nr:HipA domain-containing protein [Clostridia bacterium]HOR89009.1 HipA domain-containing protein [Clostridia bacterium]
MNCLCCGKPLVEKNNASFWHDACVKKFFFTKKFPSMDLSDEILERYVNENVKKGISVAGVQKKISLQLTNDNNLRLTLVNYPTGYILKPQVSEYSSLPEAEYLVMRMAFETGIKTVPFALLMMEDNSYAFITRRVDRILISKRSLKTHMLAMEDFCQLSGRLTADKYHGSYEQCAKIISRYSINSGLDLSELFFRIVFSYAVGNSDMHLKNFSLIETAPGSRQYVLSSAYDLLPVNIILPEDEDQFALTLNGKKRNIRRKDFLTFAENSQIPIKSAEKIINQVVSLKDTYLSLCRDSYLPDNMKSELEQLITARISVLNS